MDELRKAVLAVAEEAQIIERQMVAWEDPPSKAQLKGLQRSIDRMQQRLNGLQTGPAPPSARESSATHCRDDQRFDHELLLPEG
jgi:hypothetical protein